MTTRRSIPEHVSAALTAPIGRLARLDALTAVAVCRDVSDALNDAQAEVARIRRIAVRELRAAGYTLGELAELTGLSRNRVHQIAKGYNLAERARRKE